MAWFVLSKMQVFILWIYNIYYIPILNVICIILYNGDMLYTGWMD